MTKISFASLAVLSILVGCGNSDESNNTADASTQGGDASADAQTHYVLGAVVIDPDGKRTTYIQAVESLEGPFNNTEALEVPGSGNILANETSLFAGLSEEPTWVRYSVSDEGTLEETGRISFLNTGATAIDYGNVFVDENTAVSVFSGPAVAVIWNPSTMEIVNEVDLSHLVVEGFSLEVFTTSTNDGLVYIPGRWADWTNGRIRPGVTTTIINPETAEIVGIAQDDRCDSGGRIVFAPDGYAYVMADGRNFSSHMFENAGGEPAQDNCILRIAPGETDFDEDFYVSVPDLTGGLQSITEFEVASDGTGVAFSKIFYPEQLPEGVEANSFAFWNVLAHKTWRFELGDVVTAEEVGGVPFSTIGFTGSSFQGKHYSGSTVDGVANVYETDPEANTTSVKFTMDGYFYGLWEFTN